MPVTRRNLMKYGSTAAVMIGASTILPYAAFAQSGAMEEDIYDTDNGEIAIIPVAHASFVMKTPSMVIYNDPVGGADTYAGMPAPDLVLLTHEHGDHYNVETLQGIVADNTQIIANPAVFEMLPEDLKSKASAIANGDSTTVGDMPIDAIPAYNITEDRLKYHPQGRDNGYVLNIDGVRVYVAGDTEDIPEMRALTDIDIAFVPMNLPYTMDEEQAASAINAFKPTYVYPYHYRDSDIDKFAGLVGDGVEVKRGPWYEG
ncbi:MBL fold metallo-hydrolase [Hoeflea sp. WL0058]|uniref:MBL fold metallo-hydrolase n=1 Tax=Flavimaribacter sediminis TaxID=2865987 RepID=A0AAE2ZRL3_9HYPH|nr:MBL fold metallo-hydrolase [Flavimaribacter sediminis]MBW8639525.1 MBL fold metallo-hydrolase [Flavimaribacter sediminis]